MFIQFKLQPEKVTEMLDKGKFKISQRSENQIGATKPLDYGRINVRLKREESKYTIKMHHHWLANIHYEHGLRPQRDFDSKKVQQFAERYLKPYAETE